MDRDFDKEHEILYSGASLLLGKVHAYLLRADSFIEKSSKCDDLDPKKIFFSNQERLTDFGEEVYLDEIHWWIYQKENNHDELLSKSQKTLDSLQKLKEDAVVLKNKYLAESYPELIKELKKFTESHNQEIVNLYDYVKWLAERDPCAPSILFSFAGWGSTSQMSDRILFMCTSSIDEHPDLDKKCVETSLGLRDCAGWMRCQVESEMSYEHYKAMEHDPQNSFVIDQKQLNALTSHRVLDELVIYFEKIRNSLRYIIAEIEKFKNELLPVVRILNYGNRDKEVIRFCIVQIDYSLLPISGSFGFIPENESSLKEKIFSAIRTAQENCVNIVCFPELSFKKTWVEELLPLFGNMVIVCGSYYEDSYNVCPIIIHGHIVEPPYQKCTPSPSERGVLLDEGMKSGKIVYIYKTDIGTFSTLTCIDYAQLSHHIISQAKCDIDFIVNPCYDENITRFQAQCNSDCENHNLTIIQANRADSPNGKYGKSCIISKEHKSIIDCFTAKHLRDSNDEKYLLVKVRNEEMVIADLNLAVQAPSVDLPVSYPGRLKIWKLYDCTNSNWADKTNS